MFNTLWIDVEPWDKKQMITELYDFVVPFTMIAYFIAKKDYKWLGKIGGFAVMFILITTLLTIRAGIVMPEYARLVTSGSIDDLPEVKKMGGGDYSYAEFLVCFFPILIYYYKNNLLPGIKKYYIVAAIILCFAALIQMQFFTPIILSVLVLVIAFSGRSKVKSSIVPVMIIGTFILLIPVSVYSKILYNLSFYFNPESDIYYKLQDMSQYVIYGGFEGWEGGGIEGRVSRYPVLLNLFLQNPLLGYTIPYPNADKMGGGHLYWMNKLAVYGLLGLIPFVILLYQHFKRQLKLFVPNSQFYYLIAVMSIVVLGFMKVLVGRPLWMGLIFVLPAMYYLPLIRKKKLKN